LINRIKIDAQFGWCLAFLLRRVPSDGGTVSMEFLTELDFVRLANPGVVSEQLLSPHNSTSTRVTITRVTVQPGASQPRHVHDSSEQVWIALQGAGVLKLAQKETRPFQAGQVARFSDGSVHGFKNTGVEPFVYIAVTAPPINFDYAYTTRHEAAVPPNVMGRS
jgi:mannose-6-phosphate isomerase-like protein (cupin superfamily)